MASTAKAVAALFAVQHVTEEVDTYEAERELRRQENAQKRKAQAGAKAKRALKAARQLEKGGPRELDPRLLLDELTVDAKIKQLVFAVRDGSWVKHITVERMRLRRIGTERRRNPRMRRCEHVWIDAKGIHLRWGSCGGLNLPGTPAKPPMDSTTLLVSFLQSAQSAA